MLRDRNVRVQLKEVILWNSFNSLVHQMDFPAVPNQSYKEALLQRNVILFNATQNPRRLKLRRPGELIKGAECRRVVMPEAHPAILMERDSDKSSDKPRCKSYRREPKAGRRLQDPRGSNWVGAVPVGGWAPRPPREV
ncbi:hypothetical protein NL676_021018 [Syzygium grande]|nr:hypothetical protein NL676_021018 [Syzygium grande]